MGLIFVTETDLALEPAPVAFCSDSSSLGYALYVTRASNFKRSESGETKRRRRKDEDETLDAVMK